MKRVNEKDKRFILALVAAAITILNIVIIAMGAYYGNDLMVQQGTETLKFTFPLTLTSWSYYFSAKTEKETR